ncbi:MAG: hypothetical protein Q8M08_01100 [Bacteroidales bacterium]|nr:hypothetical protein [Bacteroidales bacterium]
MSTEQELTKNYSGIFGNQVVLRNRRGKSVMTIPLNKPKKEPTEKQRKVRENFKLASLYAQNILQDPDMLVAYTAKARNGLSAYIVAMTDYLRPPVVVEINTGDYDGKPGNKIHVVAFDFFAITEVTVQILDNKGVEIEKGNCVQDPVTGNFDFTATVVIDNLKGVAVIAKASDYPGHTGRLSVIL